MQSTTNDFEPRWGSHDCSLKVDGLEAFSLNQSSTFNRKGFREKTFN